jgi:hypothetical protein
VFRVENPIIWARFIRIDFLTHYGDEFYCPVSLLRVFGSTMMEDLRQEEDLKEYEAELHREAELALTASGGLQTTPSSVSASMTISQQSEPSTIPSGEAHFNATTYQPTLTVPQAAASDKSLDVVPSAVDGCVESTVSLPLTDEQSSAVASSTAASFDLQSSGPTVSPKPVDATNSPVPEESKFTTSDMAAIPTIIVSPVTTIPASTSTQESVFKTIIKRLNNLETNATLSQRFLEEQSKLLRNTIQKVELNFHEELDKNTENMHQDVSRRLQKLVCSLYMTGLLVLWF